MAWNRTLWRQNGATIARMPSVQIKNVPDDVHVVLRRRADEAGQSLQEYLLALLTEHAGSPTLSEVLARAGSRTGSKVTREDVVAVIRAARDAGDPL